MNNYTLNNYTLVLINVQDKYLKSVTQADREAVLQSLEREIEAAKTVGAAIILCERDTEAIGATSNKVTSLLAGYKKQHSFSHTANSVAEEVLAVCRQQRFVNSHFRLCGFYGKSSVTPTAEKIRSCTNYQSSVEIVTDACGDITQPYASF